MKFGKRRIAVCLVLLALVALCMPVLVEACKVKEKDWYDLDLSVSVQKGTTTIILKANLEQVTETFLHYWVSKSNPVYDADVYFYSCDSKGHGLKLLGHSDTNRNGDATFSVTLTRSGSYWFISEFVSGSGKRFDGHSR